MSPSDSIVVLEAIMDALSSIDTEIFDLVVEEIRDRRGDPFIAIAKAMKARENKQKPTTTTKK